MDKRNILIKKAAIALFILSSFAAYSQKNPMLAVAEKYFRAHPFDMKFSTFIRSLQKDPWFTTDQSVRRSDSGFFYLSGVYRNFNPFHFVPKEIRLIVAEEQVVHSDSSKTLDTIINLQLMAVADSGAAGMKMVRKEFTRFNNNQSAHFSTSTTRTLSLKGTVTGEVYSYYVFPFSVSPVAAAWGLFDDSNQYVFTITIRFKLRENVPGYILTPGELGVL